MNIEICPLDRIVIDGLAVCLGIYRETVPKEVEKMIEEAASFGNPMSDDEIQYEMKRANHWATIGVGIAGYYQR